MKRRFIYLLPPPNITGTLHLGHFFICCYTGIFSRILSLNNIYCGIDHAGTGAVIQAKILDRIREEIKNAQCDQEKKLAKEKLILYIGLNDKDSLFFKLTEQKITPEIMRHVFEAPARKNILESTMYSNLDFYFTLDQEYDEICNKILNSIPLDNLVYPLNYDIKDKVVLADSEISTQLLQNRMYSIKFEIYNVDEYQEQLTYCKDIKNIDNKYYIIVNTTRPETIAFEDLIITKISQLNGMKVINPVVCKYTINKILEVKYSENFNWDGPGEFVKMTSLYSDIDNEHVKSNFPKEYEKSQLYFSKCPNKEIFTDFSMLSSLLSEKCIESFYDYMVRVPVAAKTGNLVYKAPFLTQIIRFSDKTKNNAIKDINNAIIEPKRFKQTMSMCIEQFKDWKITRYHNWGIKYGRFVLDTWFSSSVCCICLYKKMGIKNIGVITGNDICDIWVSRMFLMNALYKEITGEEIKLTLVQSTGLITDSNGIKMSKSKGNIISFDYLKKYSPLARNLFALDSFTRDSTFRFLSNKLDYAEKIVRKVDKIFELKAQKHDLKTIHPYVALLCYRSKLFFRGCLDILKLKRKIYSLIIDVDKFIQTTPLNSASIALLQKLYKKILINKICPEYNFNNK